MPEMSDIFVLQANASEVVAAMAQADAAATQSKAVLRNLAKESVAGQRELMGALTGVSDAHVALTGKIAEVDRAYKEWTKAAAAGAADAAAKETAYKSLLNEVQQLTSRTATITVAAKEQITAATQRQAEAERAAAQAAADNAAISAGNSRLGILTHVEVTADRSAAERLQIEQMIAQAKRDQVAAQQEALAKSSMALVVVTQEAVEQDKLRASRIEAMKAAEHMAVVEHAGAAAVDEATAKKIEQYARLKKEEAELQAAMKRTEKDITAGVPKAAEAYGVLSNRLREVTKQKQTLGNEAGTLGGKTANLNFIMGQLSYGAQDLVTVLAQPGMGLSDALRSTGNNLGVVAQVAGGPLYGALATVGIMAAAFGAKMMEAGDGAKKAKADSEEFTAVLRHVASGAKDAKDEIDDMVRAQLDLGDVEYTKITAPLNEKIIDLRNEIIGLNLDEAESTMNDPEAKKSVRLEAEMRVRRGERLKKELNTTEQKKQMLDQTRQDADERIARRRSASGIDKQFDRVDEPLQSTARVEAGMADAFGSIDEEAAIDRIVSQSGIVPANDAERARLRDRAKSLLDKSKEKMTADSERDRLMSPADREKKDAGFRRGIVNERQEELMRPVNEQERRLQAQRDDLNRSRWQATRPESEGGKRITLNEQKELDAKQESLDANTRAHHETKAAIERLIESLKENSSVTKEDTKATKDAGAAPVGGVGFRLALNPFAGMV